MKKNLKLFPADYNFKKMYNKEKANLEKILGSKVKIEHVGSTAVTGLGGKGIIDILVGAEKISDLNLIAEELMKNGYFADTDNVIVENRIFLASREHDSTLGDYHIHVVVYDSDEWDRLIIFRDELRSSKKLRREYEDLKNRLLIETEADRIKYKKLKSDFIQSVLKELNE